MFKEQVREYFTFTRKERHGIIILLIAILFMWFLPDFFSKKEAPVPEEKKKEIMKEAALLENEQQADSAGNRISAGDDFKDMLYEPQRDESKPATLFEFDPNILSPEGWKRLGLHEKTIRTIQNYLSKGGRFYKPEDIGKIYGLRKEEYERVLPYIRIEGFKNGSKETGSASNNSNPPEQTGKVFSVAAIDINTADTTAWIALPGIGSKLAARIVNFRNKLGGFCAIEQVAETYGLSDSTFQKIKNRLTLPDGYEPTKININTADVNVLKSHPYINYSLANAIVQYRNQHGNFKEVDELKNIQLVTDELFNKIGPYLTAG
ncbi:MAG: helix-hairpin-helix domain-containing protein [Bacteroidia bacterium]|nr:helix-hairpin-helix domain-containing protein [Bacteroidia bacterium]